MQSLVQSDVSAVLVFGAVAAHQSVPRHPRHVHAEGDLQTNLCFVSQRVGSAIPTVQFQCSGGGVRRTLVVDLHRSGTATCGGTPSIGSLRYPSGACLVDPRTLIFMRVTCALNLPVATALPVLGREPGRG